MRCGRYKESASACLDGRLTPREAVAYSHHCDGCAACLAYLAELRQMSLMLKSVGQPEPPPQLRRGVMARIAARRL